MPRPVLLPRLLLGSTKKHGLERGLELYCSGFILDRGRWSRPQSHSSPHCIFSGWSSATLCCLCSDFCLFCSLLRLTAGPVFSLPFCVDSACSWLPLSWCFLIFIGIFYKNQQNNGAYQILTWIYADGDSLYSLHHARNAYFN